ncbi:DMT family transporter [Paroceanicella profunda]|uniref:DMT family transporter n=1 Tax=Paroceanicella profunda TaxID=2579971 RepID=A0A5B8FIS7_9RHOB|nr:DMT family transporter [Paroceanicella profunda]QDL93448.1 DMT family transporter [Paroceanicella profunda]
MPVPVSDALRGHAAMLMFAMLVSGSFSLGGLAAPWMDPAALNALRFAIATGVMGGLALRAGALRRGAFAAPWRHLLLGGLLSVYFVLMFRALQITDPVSTGAVFTLTPVMSAVFGWLLLRQVTTPLMALSLALAAAGALWVIFRGDPAAMLRFELGRGEWLYFLGCIAHALYTPLVRKLGRGEPLLAFTFGTLFAGMVLIGGYALPALAETDFAALPSSVWVAILYTAVFTTAVTFYLLQFAAMRLPSAKVMAYTYLVPSFVMVWEGVLGHGWVAPQVLPGVAATVLALLVLLRA